MAYVPRLKTYYQEEVIPALQKEWNYKSVLAVPAVEKVVVSMGLGEAINDKNLPDKALDQLTLITGQRGVKTRAKKSIAVFKLREGMQIGVKTTLRRAMMYDFLDRLINVALPRVRDFRGLNPKGFDRNGNYSLGLKEQIIFPEIDYDKIDAIMGMNVTIVTTARSDQEGRALLDKIGLPFRKEGE